MDPQEAVRTQAPRIAAALRQAGESARNEAEMSTTKAVYGNRSTKELLRGFRTPFHLRSIKQRYEEA